MILLRGLFWILAFQAFGEAVAALLRLPLPGNLLGMAGLAVALHQKWIKPPMLEPAASTLLQCMPLFFAPAAIVVLEKGDAVLPYVLPLAVSAFVSTWVVMAAVSWIINRYE